MYSISSDPIRRRIARGGSAALLLSLVVLHSEEALAGPATLAVPAQSKYVEDLDFIDQTVRSSSAALKSKKIDWKSAVSRLRPAFAKCESDADHIRNVMELLACLRDSHTDVTRSSVGWDGLPKKFDGLYGAGIWFGFDSGKFVIRGVMEGHPQESILKPGSMLLAIDGIPAWLRMAQDRARIARFGGISSDHSLYGSLSNRMLPFGEAQRLKLKLLDPDGDVREVEVARWGPGGKAFYPSEVEIPAGVESAKNATSAFLSSELPGLEWADDESDRVAYVRITGGMNAPTVAAFHSAMDQIQGATAILLDCRWMGGGSDGSAWEMCGRFFPKGVDNGRHGRIEASGDWQFDGPVVMLQNETMVSSAETFTWAMNETGRAVTVGRPTGGWGIIPKGFSCPSGLVDFRLGVNDRPTPIRGVHTEGDGWPADVQIPFGPVFSAEKDPVRSVGMRILHVMARGVKATDAKAAFGSLFDGDLDRFTKAAAGFGKRAPRFDGSALVKKARADLVAELKQEEAALRLEDDDALPELVGLEQRVDLLVGRAKRAGISKAANGLKKRTAGAKKDRAVQKALLAIVGAPGGSTPGDGDDKARSAWLRRYGKTSLGQLVRKRLWQ